MIRALAIIAPLAACVGTPEPVGPAMRMRVETALASGEREVTFNSYGGDLKIALLIGLAMRERGAIAVVPSGATCASACTEIPLYVPGSRVSAGARFIVHAANDANWTTAIVAGLIMAGLSEGRAESVRRGPVRLTTDELRAVGLKVTP